MKWTHPNDMDGKVLSSHMVHSHETIYLQSSKASKVFLYITAQPVVTSYCEPDHVNLSLIPYASIYYVATSAAMSGSHDR